MANSRKIKDVFKTKTEYLRAGKKLLKKYGFKDGIPLAQAVPAHYITNLVKDSDSGIRAWMTDIENRRYTVIAYPTETGQREIRKKITEVDCLFKYFIYRPKSLGEKELKKDKKSYGTFTGIKEFTRNKNIWIKEMYKQLRDEGVKGAVIYKMIKHRLFKERPSFGAWTPRKRSSEEVPIISDPYNLKETTIKDIVFKM